MGEGALVHSTAKAAIDFSLDHKGDGGPLRVPLFWGRGCLFGEGPQKRVVRLLTRYLTLYSLGAEPLTIPMVRGHSLFIW